MEQSGGFCSGISRLMALLGAKSPTTPPPRENRRNRRNRRKSQSEKTASLRGKGNAFDVG
jgi:hypothetical protein